MRIVVFLDRARLFRWQLVLIETLTTNSHVVSVHFRDSCEPLPTSLTAILDFDRVRGQSGNDRLSQRMNPVAFEGFANLVQDASDITLDLSTSTRVQHLPTRVLRPLYNGDPKDYALFHALFEGRAPSLSVADTAGDRSRLWTIGLPAIEQPTRLASSLDQISSRLVQGLLRIVEDIGLGRHAPAAIDGDIANGSGSVFASASGFVSHRAASKLTRARDTLVRNRPRWHVAWRIVAPNSAPVSGSVNLTSFRIIEDDHLRFYADPFVIEREGTRHVFVEELARQTGRGVISHFTISDRGQASVPRTVLQTDHHMSYPFVFMRDGETWMLPETAAAGGLDLYRCTRFPDQWVFEQRLIEGRLHDATLFEHDGLLWIAAGTEAFQSSTWDALSLYYSRALTGPWTPHASNPVLINARSARSAGPVWMRDGQLYRPAQDCSGGYGGKISINQIVTLNANVFEERTVGTIDFSPGAHVMGPHTIGRAGGIEVVDIYARPSDLRAGYRGPIAP